MKTVLIDASLQTIVPVIHANISVSVVALLTNAIASQGTIYQTTLTMMILLSASWTMEGAVRCASINQCSCNSGYILDGDGHSCNLIQCPNPPEVEGFVFTCSSPLYVGDTCNASCAEGDADLLGNDIIQCLITGYWGAANAACIIPMPNYPPSGLTLSTSSILENVPVSATIGTFMVTDHNLYQTHIFTLEDRNDDLFRISGDNLLVNGQLNHEMMTYITEYKF